MTDRGFVPREMRQRGLTIRSYRVAADGTVSDDTGVVELDPNDIEYDALHPSTTWPACRCPQHGGKLTERSTA